MHLDAARGRVHEADAGEHLVLTPGEAHEHRPGLRLVPGLPQGFPVHRHQRVGGEDDTIPQPFRGGQRLSAREDRHRLPGLGVNMLVDVRR